MQVFTRLKWHIIWDNKPRAASNISVQAQIARMEKLLTQKLSGAQIERRMSRRSR